jgi:RHS repeat-associated protein
MNPGVWVMGGGGPGSGSGGPGGNGSGDGQGGDGSNGGNGASGGGRNAGTCGAGSRGACPNPAHGSGGTSAGDPVDPVTGRVYTPSVIDLELPGPIPLVIERGYSSASAHVDLGLGHGWSHSLAWAIEERRISLDVLEPMAAPTHAARPALGEPVVLPCGVLTRLAEGYSLASGGLVFVLDERRGSRWLLSRILDESDNEIRLAYDEGRLTHVLDSAGRLVRVRYGAGGRIAAFEVKNASAQGRWTTFRTYDHDERGDLVAATDAEGHAHRFEYDDEHRLVRRREPGGLVAELRYDRAGRCVETWCERPGNDALDPEVPPFLDDLRTPAKGFLHVKLEYGDGATEVMTSRAKRTVTGNALDKADRAAFSGGLYAYEYDGAGHVIRYVDPLGGAYVYERDAMGRVLSVTDPLGARTEHTYDPRGHLVETRDAEGGVVRYERDDRGRVTAVHDDLGLVVGYRYDDRGLLVEATLPNGGVTRMEHDGLGNRVLVVEPDGATRAIEHDFLGRPTRLVDERGLETSYTYDDRGHLRSLRGPSGAVELREHDADGNLARVVDADGRVTTLRWGGVGVVTEVVRPSGGTVRYFYDREQDLVRVVNESGEEHRYVRHLEGRIVEERTFDGRQIHYRYDALSRVTQVQVAGVQVSFVYDAAGRLVERAYSDDRKDTIEHDLLGRVAAVTSGDVRCEYARDRRGRIVLETVRRGSEVTSVATSYDALGRPTETSGPFGRLSIAPDLAGRPVAVTWGDEAPTAMRYDTAGNLVERALPGGGRIAEAFGAGSLPEWVQVRGASGAAAAAPGEPAWVGAARDVAWARTYAWSAGGLLRAVGDGTGTTYTELTRDAGAHVTERRRTTGARAEVLEAFGYGPSDQIFEPASARDYDAGGRLVRRGDVTSVYDACGRVVERRAADGRTWRMQWGDDDRLQEVVTPDDRRVAFAYDPFARRVEKRVTKAGALESVTRYVWSGDALVHEVRERATAGGDPVVEERSYAVLPGNVLPHADREGAGGPARYYVHAPNGVPEALVTGEGRVVGELGASLFGGVDERRAGLTPLRFPGQYADEETGLHYNRHRYYDPETGQYLSPEPIRLEGSLRPYAYVDGHVLEAVDVDALLRCVLTRRDGSQVVRSSGGSADSIHPAVAAAMPRTSARQPGDPRPPEGCAEPQVLSEHIRDFERRTGRSCEPGAPGWRRNLRSALREVDTMRSETGSNDAVPACANCSQTIPRLWTMAGLPPPDGRVIGGGTNASRDYNTNPTSHLSRPNDAGYQNLGTWTNQGGVFTRRR